MVFNLLVLQVRAVVAGPLLVAGVLVSNFKHWRVRNRPGWVVMGDHPLPRVATAWHAMAGGHRYGMDHYTGRFPDAASAQAYADWRNSDEAFPFDRGCHFYTTHDSLITLPDYYP